MSDEAKPYTLEEFDVDAQFWWDEGHIVRRVRATVEALEQVTRERDEARDLYRVAEEGRCRALTERDEARAKVSALVSQGHSDYADAKELVARAREEQREACAQWSQASRMLQDLVRETPLDATPLRDMLVRCEGFISDDTCRHDHEKAPLLADLRRVLR